MQTLGLGENHFAVRLSDRQTWLLFLDHIGINPEIRPAILDAIDKSERRKPEQTQEALESACPGRWGGNPDQDREIKKITNLDDLLSKLSSFDLKVRKGQRTGRNCSIFSKGHQVDAFIKIDLSIVRGLAYYTGFVYEAFEASGKGALPVEEDMMTSSKTFGNIDLPAAGFAIGDMTLSDCLEKMDYFRLM